MFTTKFLISFALYSLLQSFTDTASGKPIVDGLTACKRNDPKLDECLLNMLKQAKPQLMQGDPELNLPPLDPVHIPRVSVNKTQQNIQVDGELSNLTAKGARMMTIRTFQVNLKENTLDMVVVIPLITFVTDFDLNVTLNALFIPISGKGQCDGKIGHSVVGIHANAKVEDDKLKLDDIKVKLHIGDLGVHIIKMQDPSFVRILSEFSNTSSRMALELATPVVEDVVRQMLLRYGNRILSTLNINNLLVD